MHDPNYKPINVSMKLAGQQFAAEVQGMDNVDIFKLAYFLGATAASIAIGIGMSDQVNQELAIFHETGCTCGKADCDAAKQVKARKQGKAH